jgi:DNA polymerase-1
MQTPAPATLKKAILPNVRTTYIPDPGYTLFDCDLSGADAQVVAWEADDADMKEAFRNGLDVHSANGRAVWGDAFKPKEKRKGARYEMRDEMKRAVHGTNYGASARTIAITLGWTIREAENFQSAWFKARPGIKEWHRRTERLLQTRRKAINAFGYDITYFDRVDALLPEALAWVPQSTVGLVTSRGAVRLDAELPWVEILLQVHDSVVFQIPNHLVTPANMGRVRECLHSQVPYPDPLTIPWDLSASRKSWGACKKLAWDLSNENEILGVAA